MNDNIRKAFDAWLRAEFGVTPSVKGIQASIVDACWRAWQAAIAQQPTPPMPEARVTGAWESARIGDFNAGWNACRDAAFTLMKKAAYMELDTTKRSIAIQDELRAMLAAAPAAPVAHPDDAAVGRFAEAMKQKMAASREKGRSGWDDKAQCTDTWLSELLRMHIEKGDPVDVANFAMMLHQRGERITLGRVVSDAAAPVAQEPVAWRVVFMRKGSTSEDRLLVRSKDDAYSQVDPSLILRIEPLYAASPVAEQPDSVAVPRELLDELDQFLTDALTAADLVRRGGRSKALADRLREHFSRVSKLRALLAGGAE